METDRSLCARTLVALLLFIALTGCAWGDQVRERLWPIPTATTAVTITQGQVRDAITKLPIAAAKLQSPSITALSDVEGSFSVRSLSDDVISIRAPGYELAEIRPRPGFPLVVDLVPDAATTFRIIYDLEKRHEFGREYELLHPDVQALFSRDDFIRYMEQNRPYDIVEVSVGSTDMLASGIVLGRVYTDVAQVRIEATVRAGQQLTRRAWYGYAAKSGGLWRWFRGPLDWPTPVPTP